MQQLLDNLVQFYQVFTRMLQDLKTPVMSSNEHFMHFTVNSIYQHGPGIFLRTSELATQYFWQTELNHRTQHAEFTFTNLNVLAWHVHEKPLDEPYIKHFTL